MIETHHLKNVIFFQTIHKVISVICIQNLGHFLSLVFENILVTYTWQNILLSIFKMLTMLWNISHALDSWYYVEKHQCYRDIWYVINDLGTLAFSKKNFDKCSQIGCFKISNSTWKTWKLWQTPSNNMPQNKSFTEELWGI